MASSDLPVAVVDDCVPRIALLVSTFSAHLASGFRTRELLGALSENLALRYITELHALHQGDESEANLLRDRVLLASSTSHAPSRTGSITSKLRVVSIGSEQPTYSDMFLYAQRTFIHTNVILANSDVVFGASVALASSSLGGWRAGMRTRVYTFGVEYPWNMKV